MQQQKSGFLITAAASLALLLASCADLSAVREWSKTSLQATQYSAVVDAYADAPQRLKRYNPKEGSASDIATRKQQAEALKQILAVVADYMAALATLSADSTVDYSKDVNSVTASISKLDPTIPQETLGAVGTLVNTVLGAATKAYQAKQVTHVVEQANAPLQTILHGQLRRVIDEDFRRVLTNESISASSFYNNLVAKSDNAAANQAVKEWEEKRLQENTARVAALDAYLKVLDKVAEGHQKLYDNRGKLDAKALVSDLSSQVEVLRKQIQILSKS